MRVEGKASAGEAKREGELETLLDPCLLGMLSLSGELETLLDPSFAVFPFLPFLLFLVLCFRSFFRSFVHSFIHSFFRSFAFLLWFWLLVWLMSPRTVFIFHTSIRCRCCHRLPWCSPSLASGRAGLCGEEGPHRQCCV